MKFRKTFCSRVIAFAVSCLFCFESSVLAAPANIFQPVKQKHAASDFDYAAACIDASQLLELEIPVSLGSVRTRWEGTGSPSGRKLVVHIQDAHANFQAQRNMAAILDLVSRRATKSLLVGLEGGGGRRGGTETEGRNRKKCASDPSPPYLGYPPYIRGRGLRAS